MENLKHAISTRFKIFIHHWGISFTSQNITKIIASLFDTDTKDAAEYNETTSPIYAIQNQILSKMLRGICSGH